MTIRFNPRWLLVPALMFSLQFCRAQVEVPPSISFDLGGADVPDTQLWDLSGSYRLDLAVDHNGVETPVRVSFVLQQDGKGNLTGLPKDNTEEMEISDNGVFTVTPQIHGKVTGSGGTARVHFTIHVRGYGTLPGHEVKSVTASFTVDAETDPATGELIGSRRSKVSVNLSGVKNGSFKGRADVALPMPNGANAAWNLTMNLVALKKLTGTGAITTPVRALGLNLAGAYRPGIDAFRIHAQGANNVPNTLHGKGITANIVLPTTFDSLQFNGKVLGQRLSFTFPEAD